jgi:hypothetical protein
MSTLFKKDGKTYDVTNLDPKAQNIFTVLVQAKNNLDAMQIQLAIAEAAVVKLSDSLSEYLVDEAIVEDDSIGNK